MGRKAGQDLIEAECRLVVGRIGQVDGGGVENGKEATHEL